MRFTKLPVLAFGMKHHWTGFHQLYSNIMKLWKVNGNLFLSQYLAECARATICWAGHEIYKSPVNGVRISLSRAGLPVIIPAYLRTKMYSMRTRSSSEGWLITKVVLTILSVYRVIGCPPKLNLGTITNPFNGVVRTLPLAELSRAIGSLHLPRLKSPDFSIISESSGPNYPRATWSASTDAFAFMFYPRNWVAYMKWSYNNGWSLAILWMLWMNFLSLLFGPLLIYFGFKPRYIGRLAKLNEARGKVRVIAICDYWTQLVLRPLHDSLFKLLSKIQQDGTFSQVTPFEALMEKARLQGSKVNSFDLSAATDRLPIEIQCDILDLLGVDGKTWKALLDRPWYLVQRKEGVIVSEEAINYSVGQPMGAYSSWGMLALTHHIIVQVAARRVGHTNWFCDYALLGDDIVILGEDVSSAYLAIMRDLGVEINLLKSHQGLVGEFAKHWIHPHYGDLSPIGAGNILVAVRNYKLIPSVVLDAVQKNFPYPLAVINNLLVISKSFNRKINKRTLTAMSLLMMGPTGALGATNQLSVETLEAWLSVATNGVKRGFILQAIQNAVMQIRMDEDEANQTQYSVEQDIFNKSWWRYAPFHWTKSFSFLVSLSWGPGRENYFWSNGFENPPLFEKTVSWTFGFNFLDTILPTSINIVVPRIFLNKEALLWMLLVRASPAFVAYRDRSEPDEAQWYSEEFLSLEGPIDSESLAAFGQYIRSMMGIPSGSVASIDWTKEKSLRTYLDSQAKFIKIVERRLRVLSKPKGPVNASLVVAQYHD